MVEVLDRVTMQVFVRGYCTMIAAPVQCDVDGIPKGLHCARVSPTGKTSKVSQERIAGEYPLAAVVDDDEFVRESLPDLRDVSSSTSPCRE